MLQRHRGNVQMAVVAPRHPAQFQQTPDLAAHGLARQAGGGGDGISIARTEAAAFPLRHVGNRGRLPNRRRHGRSGLTVVLERADIVQGNLAEQNRQQDVAVELLEPTTHITHLMTREQQRHRTHH